jgi:hypothetical protein
VEKPLPCLLSNPARVGLTVAAANHQLT